MVAEHDPVHSVRAAGRHPRPGQFRRLACSLSALWLGLWAMPGVAALDLQGARVERLENGLSLILLPDSGFPAVSTQVLYRTGGRDEQYGRTGLAHFLEHMAFRATENFPDTEVVSRIYAAGGEWHGYTWIDQTTYFSTVPVAELDTVLAIEADRMARLVIDEADLEPERGAVLAEMHGYENDPASLLHDQLVFTAFQGHPYRNNVIGLESDIQAVQLSDLEDFYRRHYHPANAVLAIVGDFDPGAVTSRVRALFGSIPSQVATTLPRTREMPQQGLRRIELSGPVDTARFEIAWQAPSARSEDFAPFLVLRELLAGSEGINFQQDSGVAAVGAHSRLGGIGGDLQSWYPVSAQTYLFSVSGSLPLGLDEAGLEATLEARVASLREHPAPGAELARAVDRLRRELVLDIQTTEDAAHQLAYFDGLGALEGLLGLEAALDRVSAGDVQRVARRYLGPEQRSIGWFRPGPALVTGEAGPESPAVYGPGRPGSSAANTPAAGSAEVLRLPGGLPVIWQANRATPSAHIQLVLAGERWDGPGVLTTGSPEPGFSTLEAALLPGELPAVLDSLADALQQVGPLAGASPAETAAGTTGDPAERLAALMGVQSGLAAHTPGDAPRVLAIVVSGDLDRQALVQGLEARFGGQAPAGLDPAPSGPADPAHHVNVAMPHPVAQAQLGYGVAAAALGTAQSAAWQALLYVLSHGYEGRLGKEAISRRGLIYYIDSQYQSGPDRGWISLAIGVDPGKLQAMGALLQSELAQLASRPPTDAEVHEAVQHLLGRHRTAHQSNRERVTWLARQWIHHGRLPPDAEIVDRLSAVTPDQVRALVPRFLDGTTFRVSHPGPDSPAH